MHTPLWVVRLEFSDREGQQSEMQFRGAASLSTDEVIGSALDWAARIIPLSDAIITAIHCTKWIDIASPGVPGPNSNVKRRAWLFYRNSEGSYEAYAIPSIKVELLETSGPYSGVRLISKDIAGEGVFEPLETALSQTITVEGEPWDFAYINGGLLL